MIDKQKEYRYINLPSGNTLQIKFDYEGVVYDLLDKNGEVIREYGYDLYHEDIPVMRVKD